MSEYTPGIVTVSCVSGTSLGHFYLFCHTLGAQTKTLSTACLGSCLP
jgi:hypothetical protein